MSPATILARLKALLPPWFDDEDEILDGLLSGIAAPLAHVADLVDYAKLQTRVATATGGFLDLAAYDFLSTRIQRRAGELDPDFSARIRREVLRPRDTREAIAAVVTDLVGLPPTLTELWNPGDCGAYDVGTSAYAAPDLLPEMIGGYDSGLGGYDVGAIAYVLPRPVFGYAPGAGVWGSLDYPSQIFIKVRRGPAGFVGIDGAGGYDTPGFAYGGDGQGAPKISGYDDTAAGYETGGFAYVTPTPPYDAFAGAGYYGPDQPQNITDAEIYAAIASTKAAGVVAWTAITPV